MIKIDKPTANALTLIQTIENLGGKCAYCDHVYESVSDIQERKPKIVRVREFGLGCACEKCWEKDS